MTRSHGTAVSPGAFRRYLDGIYGVCVATWFAGRGGRLWEILGSKVIFGATPAMAERDARFVQRREELAAQRRRDKARQDEVCARCDRLTFNV